MKQGIHSVTSALYAKYPTTTHSTTVHTATMELFLENTENANVAPQPVEVGEDTTFGDLATVVCKDSTFPSEWVHFLHGEEGDCAADVRLCDASVEAGMTLRYYFEGRFECSKNIDDVRSTGTPVQLARWELPCAPLHIEASAEDFRDQGWGNKKGSVFLRLHRNGAEVAVLKVFGTARVETENGGAKTLDPAKSLPFLAQCEPGDELILEYRVGGGGGHTLKVRNLKTAVHFGHKFVPVCTLPEIIPHDTPASRSCYSTRTDFNNNSALKTQVTEFFQQHNPAKVAEIDTILTAYAGREDTLMRDLHTNYNVPFAADSTTAPDAQRQQSEESEESEDDSVIQGLFAD